MVTERAAYTNLHNTAVNTYVTYMHVKSVFIYIDGSTHIL